jgi:excinuclease ABC subunit C
VSSLGREKLKQKIRALPDKAGVYIFKDKRGIPIYIGKANSLKKRVQSYFNRPLDTKTQAMAAKIVSLECRLTASPAQARILEAELVRRIQPQYNIDLKDDKSFLAIKISAAEFPVVSLARSRAKEKGAAYFGPYPDAARLRQALKIIRRIFGFRSCRRFPHAPCLYYRLKLCPAPCAGKISRRAYAEIIRQIKLFLQSRQEELLRRLYRRMQEQAKEKRFEEAALLRDRVAALSAIQEGAPGASSDAEIRDLEKRLRLAHPPLRIEAFDISNISGREATGSMVSFYKGLADKNNYRRFRIKGVAGIDDYAMLREVVGRRYLRLVNENLPLPDLVLIDGGRAHLLAAAQVCQKLGLNLAIASIAKEEENIYIQAGPSPIKLKEGSPALNLIRRIRDEAHRFALRYHHLLRKKKIVG